jgi:general secretion pathway protein K
MIKTRISQSGMAILLALGSVAIVAALAAAAIARQSMLIQSEEIARDRNQAKLIAMAAMDWARLILRQDARGSSIDHLGEPWAFSIQNASISDFIDLPEANSAILSGRIIDEHGKINLMGTTTAKGTDDLEYDLKVISFLADKLKIANVDVEVILAARHGLIRIPLMDSLSCPRLDELGISPTSAKALAPYLTILPERTALNVNTASELALQAYIPGLSAAQAQLIASGRKTKPFDSLPQFASAISPTPLSPEAGSRLSFQSFYFSATMSLTTPMGHLDKRALLKRTGSTVSTLCLRSIDPSEVSSP